MLFVGFGAGITCRILDARPAILLNGLRRASCPFIFHLTQHASQHSSGLMNNALKFEHPRHNDVRRNRLTIRRISRSGLIIIITLCLEVPASINSSYQSYCLRFSGVSLLLKQPLGQFCKLAHDPFHLLFPPHYSQPFSSSQ
jgi:hypothetical protein